MEGPTHIEELALNGLTIRIYLTLEVAPPLLLLPSGENNFALYESLAKKFWLENFTVFLFPPEGEWEDLRIGFKKLKNFLKDRGRLLSFWVWGEGKGTLWALKLAHNFSTDIAGLVLDSLRPEDKTEAAEYLKSLRKPYLMLHPQLDSTFPFTEAERMFILSPAHAKKLLLMPGMQRGETIVKGGDLYIQTITEFINPRVGRWARERKTHH